MITLTVRDGTTSGDALAALELQLESERLTVRELIRARVHQEVRAYNAKPPGGRFLGLVQPTGAEQELNGRLRRRPRRIDPDAQVKTAIRAFERGHVLLLVDDRQVEGLDTEVTLRTGSTVAFLKLVPLVGG
jgi:hypothetical protein